MELFKHIPRVVTKEDLKDKSFRSHLAHNIEKREREYKASRKSVAKKMKTYKGRPESELRKEAGLGQYKNRYK